MTYNPTVVRTMNWDPAQTSREVLLNREWIVTNGLGGYASGTVSGAITRRYHGLLIAALAAPLGRVVMWNHVSESLRFEDKDQVFPSSRMMASSLAGESTPHMPSGF